ncbi:acyl-CoA thioesterase [Litorihabitans aurantiacus]|uniref:Acyl-CoA thioesterase II n=1 Tax=Litorihabitans aurantiacus TaxID=1930061 RepID=A0AA38CPQ3_9MICO|nr:acyl-CoA thioesterase domain-containing protein [Litorihabitans aurantiacus]GMA31913.1 acyl-CoA thioesterase II [Litorihabitans aurantiacus]
MTALDPVEAVAAAASGEGPVPSGEEVFAAVVRSFDLHRTDATTFAGDTLPHANHRIYGGQVFGQAIVAAGRTVAPDRFVHSAHGYFLRPGRIESPLTFAVEELRDGGSFSARRTHALQDGVPILSLIASFQTEQDGVTHAVAAPPDVPGPECLPSSDALFRSSDAIARRYLAPRTAFDVRHVEPQLFLTPDPEPRPHQAMWIRAHGELTGDAVSDRNLRAALLVYACDQAMLEPVLRRHDVSWSSPGLSVASLDHATWWHRDVDVTQWLLYVQDSPAAQGGRGLGTARVYDTAGHLVASIAQEGMVRVRDRETDRTV